MVTTLGDDARCGLKKHCIPTTAWAAAENVRDSADSTEPPTSTTRTTISRNQQNGDITVYPANRSRLHAHTTHAIEICRSRAAADASVSRKENSRGHGGVEPVESTGAYSLPDLGDEEWRTMACNEASNGRDFAVDLAPGQAAQHENGDSGNGARLDLDLQVQTKLQDQNKARWVPHVRFVWS